MGFVCKHVFLVFFFDYVDSMSFIVTEFCKSFYLWHPKSAGKDLRDWPVMKYDLSQGNFLAHFLFNSKIKTTYPGVLPPISSFAPRPKLGLWWSK